MTTIVRFIRISFEPMKPETYIVLPILVAENVENVYTVVEIPHLYRTTPAQMRVRVAKSSFAQG